MLTKLPYKLDLQFFAEEPPVDPVKNNPTDPQDPPAEPKMYDEAYVKQLRDEAASNRIKVNQAKQEAQQQQQALVKKVLEAFGINPDPNLEFEKQLETAQQAAQVAEQRANEKLIKAEVKSIGAELGIIDMDVAYMLADKESFVVKEDGSVEGVKEALEKVIEAKPFLAAAQGEAARQKGSGYNPGEGKGNPPKQDDEYTAARERARAKLKK